MREVREELSVTVAADSAERVGTFHAQAHGHPDGTLVRMTCYTAGYHGVLRRTARKTGCARRQGPGKLARRRSGTGCVPVERREASRVLKPAVGAMPPALPAFVPRSTIRARLRAATPWQTAF
ncbi:hypothetical protein Prum_087840 [Phytohabitans rumicis]|uniref:Nudix hydrolase domain-containing protein n=1 Tax=Phytohabitans rumicis TaxID=1076125 RepID=A0A6V8LD41_9ACTN|nr:hypothetical protein Prum_087840 [Phytohabitans rumicis]